MKAYWGCGDISPPFFTSALSGGEWSVFIRRPGESTPVPSLLEAACCQSEGNVFLQRESNSDSSAVQSVSSHYTNLVAPISGRANKYD
jgi:hypothetical protein